MTTITDKINLTESIPNVSPCKTCIISTLRSNAHSSHIRKGELSLKLVHSDVLGPFRIRYNRARYIVTFLYDATQLSKVYYIKSKGEVFDCFRHFKAQYKRPGRTIQRLRTDNREEYSSVEMQRYLFAHGIIPEFTVPDNPQQNSTAEKFGHILWSRAKTLLKHSGLDFIYWPELVKTSNYLRIRTLYSRLPGTPYEA
jgi:transposase InsO family protein